MAKDCARDEVLVRARRKGDIEKLFRTAKVKKDEQADYLYRARVKRSEVAAALALEVDRVVYPNFKTSVKEPDLHRAYARVWSDLAALQPTRPWQFCGPVDGFDFDSELAKFPLPPGAKAGGKKKRRRRTRRSLRRGS